MELRIILFLTCISSAKAWFYGRPAPNQMTRGGVWPLPQKVTPNNAYQSIDSNSFQFTSNISNCAILQNAFKRYRVWAFPYKNGLDQTDSSQKLANESMTTLNVYVTNGCPKDDEYPQMDMDESYTITMDLKSLTASLTAKQIWGALRGLDSFSQLIFMQSNGKYYINSMSIDDKPRFAYRGVMLDSARHFLSVGIIKRNLDLMAMSKFNVFHWHLTDSESFPYESKIYPNLSAKGAYSPRHVYKVEQIKDIISYARDLGIRVVAEFDTPGHMGAWGPGQPGLLAKCGLMDAPMVGWTEHLGMCDNNTICSNIIDPTKPANIDFLRQFFQEALSLFPDKHMHFGGDETLAYQISCWWNNTDINKFMTANNWTCSRKDGCTDLLHYYFQQLVNVTQSGSKKPSMIFWQEVLDQKVAPNNSIAHVWKGGTLDSAMQEIATATEKGYPSIFSSCWYLNYIKYGAVWDSVNVTNKYNKTDLGASGDYYECDPQGFTETKKGQKDLVLGGEVCMWGEYVDGTNVIPRLWPNAAAAGERLWSDQAQTKKVVDAWPRLHEHRCRLLSRGYQVETPNDPDFCPDFWDPSFQVIQPTSSPNQPSGLGKIEISLFLLVVCIFKILF